MQKDIFVDATCTVIVYAASSFNNIQRYKVYKQLLV